MTSSSKVLALRQQLAIYERKRKRPSIQAFDRLFWSVLARHWSDWRRVLVVVRPETVIGWHRKGFRLLWTRKSQRSSLAPTANEGGCGSGCSVRDTRRKRRFRVARDKPA